ncbi:34687_t:CDS:2 [Gigaspora margarita]|uniref:34687_t:CDS:1 n=1 Tax=Gigaspora margarita TaxID=4874 RepID=A0ABN7UGC7_GIGMA|nr:34687_t:CDS:2 [Gigaspora margarita]
MSGLNVFRVNNFVPFLVIRSSVFQVSALALQISHIDPLINQINDLIKESGLSSIEELQNSQN